jgi:virulence-associated protein VapD
MEKRINTRIQQYISKFKDDIRAKLVELGFENTKPVNDLLEHIYEYDRLVLEKDDFVKRKRVQNAIPSSNRCNAKRANGIQCTRRRKTDCEFCGTHFKGTPHGMIGECATDITAADNTTQKMEVIATEIKGIVYYVDKYDNVYKTEDILQGVHNPAIIAKCVKQGSQYTIPEFGLV